VPGAEPLRAPPVRAARQLPEAEAGKVEGAAGLAPPGRYQAAGALEPGRLGTALQRRLGRGA